MCWATALAQHLNAKVLSSRPGEDPPDVDFRIQEQDGTERTVWGEVTAVYCNNREAERLWNGRGNREVYREPDAVMGTRARAQVERKRQKCLNLAQRRGPGHLLVLLLSPLTSRSTRVEAERSVRELLESAPGVDSDPFETVWLGYRLPDTTPDEQENPQHAFQDGTDAERFQLHEVYLGQAGPARLTHPAARPRIPTSSKRFSSTRSNASGSGAVDARCVSPAVILHAHVPSGPTTILVSTGPSPTSSAVTTMKPSSLTRMPAMACNWAYPRWCASIISTTCLIEIARTKPA